MNIELIIGIGFAIISGLIGYAVNHINKISTKVNDLEKALLSTNASYQRADDKLKGHIYNCANYKPRHQLDEHDL